jgi:hypothetical protein
VWWLRLGIQHQRIRPASPQENGAHERMHRTLKAETTRPPAADLARQQRAFTAFRHEYNEERPHAALDGQTPAARYIASPLANSARRSRPRESTSRDANTSWIRTKVRRLIGVPHDNTWTPSR